jgi:hypothetical protein
LNVISNTLGTEEVRIILFLKKKQKKKERKKKNVSTSRQEYLRSSCDVHLWSQPVFAPGKGVVWNL